MGQNHSDIWIMFSDVDILARSKKGTAMFHRLYIDYILYSFYRWTEKADFMWIYIGCGQNNVTKKGSRQICTVGTKLLSKTNKE